MLYLVISDAYTYCRTFMVDHELNTDQWTLFVVMFIRAISCNTIFNNPFIIKTSLTNFVLVNFQLTNIIMMETTEIIGLTQRDCAFEF